MLLLALLRCAEDFEDVEGGRLTTGGLDDDNADDDDVVGFDDDDDEDEDDDDDDDDDGEAVANGDDDNPERFVVVGTASVFASKASVVVDVAVANVELIGDDNIVTGVGVAVVIAAVGVVATTIPVVVVMDFMTTRSPPIVPDNGSSSYLDVVCTNDDIDCYY